MAVCVTRRQQQRPGIAPKDNTIHWRFNDCVLTCSSTLWILPFTLLQTTHTDPMQPASHHCSQTRISSLHPQKKSLQLHCTTSTATETITSSNHTYKLNVACRSGNGCCGRESRAPVGISNGNYLSECVWDAFAHAVAPHTHRQYIEKIE